MDEVTKDRKIMTRLDGSHYVAGQLNRKERYSPVLVGGFVASFLVFVLGGLQAAFAGEGFFYPLQLFGACFFQADAYILRSEAILVGVGLLFLTSVLLAAAYRGITSGNKSRSQHMIAGPLFGLATFAILIFTAVRAWDPLLYTYVAKHPWAWAAISLAFGGGLSLPWWRRPSLRQSDLTHFPTETDERDRRRQAVN